MVSGVTASLAACGSVAAAVSGMAWAVRAPSSSVFGSSVWKGPAGGKRIALTFDDGPCRSTPALLEILERHGAKATFFQVGSNVQAFPGIAREVLSAGHEIGNHSQTHPNFALRSSAFIVSEFSQAQQQIQQATGFQPVWMRAPFGVRWFGFNEMQRQLGLTGVMWRVIGLDWKLTGPAIAHRVLSRVQDGDIICLHDGRGTLKDPDVQPTLDAVREIVPKLIGTGYHFETVTQLLCQMKSARPTLP